ncbi:MAG: hypothetical protein JWQ21_2168 [Herminiimonas sp.]|nr:hypothetical protein [Herminiimonas sp.]
MPTYDYVCDDCGPFEQRRPMAESNAPASCPQCGTPAQRRLCATQLNLMSGTDRIAHARNEKSAHAPEVVHRISAPEPHDPRASHRHHGHGHEHKPASPARPWMIGH